MKFKFDFPTFIYSGSFDNIILPNLAAGWYRDEVAENQYLVSTVWLHKSRTKQWP